VSEEPPMRNKKLLIQVYERIAPRDCGAHQRIWQVIDACQALGAEVQLIASDGPRPARARWTPESKEILRQRGIKLHLAPFHAGTVDFWIAATAYLWVKRLRHQPMALPSGRYYLRPQLQALWRGVLRREKIDAAVLNFAYWQRLARLARQLGVPTAVDMIDLLADQLVATAESEQGRSLPPDYVKAFAADEERCLSASDCVLAINPLEGARLRSKLRVPVVDLPFCRPEAPPRDAGGNPTDLLIVGSYIEHNKRGLRQFMEGAWPEIKQARPGVRLTVIGGVGEDLAPDPNVVRLGQVADLTPHYHGARIVLLTSVAGAGIKIKAIEALAHHTCILAHEHSVHGIRFEPGVHGEVVDHLGKSARPVLELLDDDARCSAYRRAARDLFAAEFDIRRGQEVLGQVLAGLIASSPRK
jgi:hypothetical protein